MKKTIFFKIFSAYLTGIVVISSLLVFFSFRIIKSNYIETISDNLENHAVSLRKTLNPLVIKEKYSSLDSLVKKLGEKIDTRITVVDGDGRVLADSKEDPRVMENHGTRPEILKSFYGKAGTSLRYSETLGREMLYVAIPIYNENDTIIGSLRLSLFLKQIHVLLSDVRNNVLITAIILVLLSIIAAFFFTRSISRPINKIVTASKSVASGNLDTRVYIENKGQIKELGDTFNEMIERIKELVSELSQQKESLNAIISSITEGLLVIDENEQVLMANESMKEILNLQNVQNKHYWKVIKEPHLGDIINEVIENKKGEVKEVNIDSRTFICSSTFVEKYNEVVLTLHEITELKEIERIKKDFVTNVSHELRTPLTAIKGFLETLKESVKEENKNYVEIIRKHTDRLINIIKDLLSLSEVERGVEHIEFEKINIEESIKSSIRIYREKIEGKDLDLNLEIEEGLPEIDADLFKIDELLINLIENSLKYTEEGGISIKAERDNNFIKISVKDTGIGIPEEHQEKIFERFYVVDKSRSRDVGGTGLGLSIVKHIVLLHNGKIEVDSEPGKGTKFTVYLPLEQN